MHRGFDQPAYAIDFMRSQVVEDDKVTWLERGASTCSAKARKASPSVGDSMLMLANTPSMLRAANTVSVR